MEKTRKAPKSVDAYVAGFPAGTRRQLERLRAALRKAAPGATEGISYGIPAFTLGRLRVHFAAYEGHLGFYPGAEPLEVFAGELSAYELRKGTVRFPLGEPLPLKLIVRMARFRLGLATGPSSAGPSGRA